MEVPTLNFHKLDIGNDPLIKRMSVKVGDGRVRGRCLLSVIYTLFSLFPQSVDNLFSHFRRMGDDDVSEFVTTRIAAYADRWIHRSSRGTHSEKRACIYMYSGRMCIDTKDKLTPCPLRLSVNC